MFGNKKLSNLLQRGGFMLLIINTNNFKWTNKILNPSVFVQNASVTGSWFSPVRKLTLVPIVILDEYACHWLNWVKMVFMTLSSQTVLINKYLRI